ncbi:hypothetical protein PRIPAC_96360 [Pristionchus pacificus]|uniref:Uncharacterized protein n=1 Tax=Pristionchus pacificus TaxID=54126 RepID=A0A2A6BKC9_PRIPA|nr:hypothetical protein PRIPAC_96360 [Pristionchus pacificus]|eukprot:PDM66241.1 hypothetical protein PRIPAC_45466 [Pristionchus pacificus]
MFRIRSPSILEPKIAHYPLTFVTKWIISIQTLILTVLFTGHLIKICIKPPDQYIEIWIQVALYVSYIISIVSFFVALKVNKWPLIIPIIIDEFLLLGYTSFKIVHIICGFGISTNDKLELWIYIFLCFMVMAECPLTIFLSIRVLLYVKTMARAVRTTRQLSYVGSITKESLRKEEQLVRMETIKKRIFETEGVQREPRISIISLPLEERDNQSTSTVSTIPHIEISDA